MSEGVRSLEIARRMVELGRVEDAARAYSLALENGIEGDPSAELEAAVCALQFGKNYQVPYTVLHSLHRRGLFREETISIMTGAFYEPNVKDQRSRYERNCKQLSKYPYLFRKDFVPFEELPVQFYPYDDNGSYIPYYPVEDRFGDLIDFKEPVIQHYFFKNLENPVLGKDVFSQYELEYLNDNVRKSEHIGRENHIYLHYTDWAVFCAYLQCWNLRFILEDEKFVFLVEEELSQYPIDFKARFGIDYSQYPVKPIGIREVSRLIWHTQLSTHNGGDFFNEIFDDHPNLIVMPSVMMSNVEEVVTELRERLETLKSSQQALRTTGDFSPYHVQELYLMKGRTDKDLLIAIYLNDKRATTGLDPASRIAPALFFQPHFPNIKYDLTFDGQRRAVLHSDQYETIQQSPIFRNFKYIKTFTPIRRITTSYAASIRFSVNREKKVNEKGIPLVVDDVLFVRIMNRSYLRNPKDRLFQDSRLVRFEDGKLNPKATFTALAAFLDLPYTETMTYCSEHGVKNISTYDGNVIGFDPATVYRTYDEYANHAERTLLEYFLRDAYEAYGYGFQNYDGTAVDGKRIQELIDGCTVINELMVKTYHEAFLTEERIQHPGQPDEELEPTVTERVRKEVECQLQKRVEAARVLLRGLHFVNRKGQPLQFMKQLELDPALLEQALYH